jgi:hypothetical protein
MYDENDMLNSALQTFSLKFAISSPPNTKVQAVSLLKILRWLRVVVFIVHFTIFN